MRRLRDFLWMLGQNPTMLRELYVEKLQRTYREYHEHKRRHENPELLKV